MAAKTYCHIVHPTDQHSHTIIFLHGRDSQAEEFANELFESQASDGRFLQQIFPTFRWVFPQSKLRSSSRFPGPPVSQWFDIWSVEIPQERQEIQPEGLLDSCSSLEVVIAQEAALVTTSSRIILAGISQGSATAIYSLLHRQTEQLGGFIGLCSWLPFEDDGVETTRAAHRTLVLVAHSKDDPVVPVENGRRLNSRLTESGMNVTWREYEEGGHWVNEPHGIDDMVAFIKATLNNLLTDAPSDELAS